VSTITPESLIQITPDQVIVADRLRAIDADYVELLANSMAESGQHTPIQVGPAEADGRHRLIAGAHRVAAAKLANITLNARVFTGNALQQRMLEIDENLLRRELSELDRAVFLDERKRVWEALNPGTGMGKASPKKNDKNVVLFHAGAFSEDAAKRLQLSRRQVERFVARARIEPDLRERLAGTRWADHGATLDALAKAGPADRRKMVLALTRAENPARNVAAAQIEVMGSRAPVRSERAKRLDALLSAWRHADKATQREFLESVAQDRSGRELLIEMAARLQERAEADQATVVAAISGERSAA
jgi:ParB family chromosome partitioning protein